MNITFPRVEKNQKLSVLLNRCFAFPKSGWYHRGIFNSNRGPDKSSNTFSKGGVPGDFKYQNNMLINIEPK